LYDEWFQEGYGVLNSNEMFRSDENWQMGTRVKKNGDVCLVVAPVVSCLPKSAVRQKDAENLTEGLASLQFILLTPIIHFQKDVLLTGVLINLFTANPWAGEKSRFNLSPYVPFLALF
jgi:hypothetical protein